jgi:hypothetical protein
LENFTNLWFDLRPALHEIQVLSSKEKGIKTETPSIYEDLNRLHRKRLISHKTLVGVACEVCFQ